MQPGTMGLGRVGVVEGDGAARVSRLIRELTRAGRATAAVPLRLRWDEPETIEETLRDAKIDSAWLGPAPSHRRRAFAEACAKAAVRCVGPDAQVLGLVAAPAGLASELGMAWNADTDSGTFPLPPARPWQRIRTRTVPGEGPPGVRSIPRAGSAPRGGSSQESRSERAWGRREAEA